MPQTSHSTDPSPLPTPHLRLQHVRLRKEVTLPELTVALQAPGPEPGMSLKSG